jgi:hypothetical protein
MLLLRLMLVIGLCGIVATLVGVVRDIRESLELARLMRPLSRRVPCDAREAATNRARSGR